MKISDGTTMVQFRAGRLLAALEARTNGASVGSVAKRDLERYYQLLAGELAELSRDPAKALDEAEASLIIDACNGWLVEPHTYTLLWAQVADAISLDGLDRKWDVNADRLIAKLRSYTPGQTLAVIDAADRYWTLDGEHVERLRAVGLVR